MQKCARSDVKLVRILGSGEGNGRSGLGCGSGSGSGSMSNLVGNLLIIFALN